MNGLYRTYELPWDFAREDDDRLRGIAKKVLIAIFLLTLVISLLPTPERTMEDDERIPQRFAKLILEKPKPPPPPPVVEPVIEEPVVEEPKIVEEKPPEPEPEPVVEEKPPEPEPVETAREKASVAGLLPFADELAELRDNQAIASVKSDRQLAGAAGEAERSERSMITSNAGTGSGGINTAAMSRNTGGAGLSDGVETTAVSSTVAGLAAAPVNRPDAISAPARSREEIEMVFDQNKGAIYALYNRALRRDPTLQGKMVLRLTIEPSGAVSMCEIVSSEIGDPELERKLISRIKLFRFEAKDVARVTTTKPIDFFPA